MKDIKLYHAYEHGLGFSRPRGHYIGDVTTYTLPIAIRKQETEHRIFTGVSKMGQTLKMCYNFSSCTPSIIYDEDTVKPLDEPEIIETMAKDALDGQLHTPTLPYNPEKIGPVIRLWPAGELHKPVWLSMIEQLNYPIVGISPDRKNLIMLYHTDIMTYRSISVEIMEPDAISVMVRQFMALDGHIQAAINAIMEDRINYEFGHCFATNAMFQITDGQHSAKILVDISEKSS